LIEIGYAVIIFIHFYIEGIHYGGLSLHFIDSQLHLRVFTLACQAYDYETQHAINIRSFVERVLEEFGLYLTDDIFIVSDNENKMKCAFKDGVKRVGCSAHYLNKILQHAFIDKDTPCLAAQSLFKIVRGIVSKVRKCHKQSLLSTYVQMYCDTRFSGVYLMMNSFLKVFYELPTVLSDEQKKKYLKIDRDNLEILCTYLKNFCDVIEKLSCEKTPTLHLVIPYKQFLVNLSNVNKEDNPLISSLKDYIRQKLHDSWVVDDVHYIATMLHPNLKSFNHAPQNKYHAEALLRSEFEKHRLFEQQQQQQQQSLSISNKNKQIFQNKKPQLPISLDDIFDLSAPPDQFQDDTEIKSEFDKYIEDHTKIDKDANVLSYWENNKSLYPVLATIAQHVLCIPATNTSVERLFSDSGNTITNRRTRLQTTKVNQLLFIRRNLSTLRELFPPSLEHLRKRKNSSTTTTPMKKPKHSKEEEEEDNNSILLDGLDNSLVEDDDKEKFIWDY
jgi:hypothetical protein